MPPVDNRARNRLLGAAAFVVTVILAFFVGSLLNRSEANQASASEKENATSQTAAGSSSRTTVVLVPVDGANPLQEQPPVTSAPAPSASMGSAEINGERTDATALPSGAYSVAVERARAEREKRPNAGIVDPRTIAGGVESAPPHHASPSSPRRAENTAMQTSRTQPVPLYQPVPAMQVYRPENARLILTVGSEGRVQNINITQSIPGEMPRILAAVQNWRFRPATENGHPVTSSFAVDITVRPR
jgi:hypothetical protein